MYYILKIMYVCAFFPKGAHNAKRSFTACPIEDWQLPLKKIVIYEMSYF